MAQPQSTTSPEVPGLPARRLSASIVDVVLRRRRPLDEEFAANEPQLAALEERDRAFVRMLAATTLRRLGTLRHVIHARLKSGLPHNVPLLESALLVGAAQILFLDTPDHAAVDLSVRLMQADRHAKRYAGLTNAVLRAIARDKAAILSNLDPAADTPPWLLARWTRQYGDVTARAIAAANAHEAALDLTVRSDPEGWAQQLGGRMLPNGSVRVVAHRAVPALPGFDDGQWWVQDAAASLPARLLGDVRGKHVADLCAAPGGKTAQLAQAGAYVTAIDRSAARLARVSENLTRLGLSAEIVAADATQWQGDPFDAILLDAPCMATGTIRRHPDIPWLKSEDDLRKLAALQRRLLAHAATLLKPGGILVYCTCSLEGEEGEEAIAELLDHNRGMQRRPISPEEMAGCEEFVTAAGDMRTLPCHWPGPDSRMSGLDGFYAARLVRR